MLLLFFQFFYLITETYKVGTLKEMQRWAYEIFSTFLVSDSPLHVPRVDNLIIDEIDRQVLVQGGRCCHQKARPKQFRPFLQLMDFDISPQQLQPRGIFTKVHSIAPSSSSFLFVAYFLTHLLLQGP